MTFPQRALSALQHWLASSAGRRRRWSALVFWFGRRHVPFLRPLLTEGDITRVIAAVRPGDVLGVYTRRYVSSWLIPGRYKHTAIYLGHGLVAEAVAPRVRRLRLAEFLRQYDRVIVWRPKYPDEQAWKATDLAAFRSMGTGYDPFFSADNGLWYCHEYAADCVSRGGVVVEKRGPQYLAEDIGRASACVLEVGYGVSGNQGA
jgi:hypothetical protein